MTPLRTRLAAAAVAGGLVLTVPAVALAAPSRTRSATDTTRPSTAERSRDAEALRARCLEAVEDRLTTLNEASERLAAAWHVTDEHEATLAGILSETGTSLSTLGEAIGSDADPESLKAHCRSIFVDHRVFALILPRTRLVVAADTTLAVVDRLDEVGLRLEGAIAEAEAAGQDVTEAKADLEALRAAVDSARAAAAPVPDDILPLTPVDWNADHQVLVPAREALRSARTDLREARDLAREIVAGLRR